MGSPRHARAYFSAPQLDAVQEQRMRFKNAGLAPLTTRCYASDFAVFTAWCGAAGRVPLPASVDTVELYVTDLIGRGRKISTLERHVAGIQHIHRQAGLASPCGAGVRQLLCGARRILRQTLAQKDALTTGDLKRMVLAIGDESPRALRDCALLLFGFASGLRRSNLARLRPEDLRFMGEGIVAQIDREKQDRDSQDGGRQIAVPFGQYDATCPVRAVRRWLDVRGGMSGALFCQVMNGLPNGKPILGNRIGQIVQEAAARIHLDPSRYGGHSLRAGFATEALKGGASEIAVARHLGHASLETTRIYVRKRELFDLSPCLNLGL